MSYPGTHESVNFRVAKKLCQIPQADPFLWCPVSTSKSTKKVPTGKPTTSVRSAKQLSDPGTRKPAGLKARIPADTKLPEVTVLTIGHSTRGFDEFVEILRARNVERLVDVRSIPKSRRMPHFNGENLAAELTKNGIEYVQLRSLGGRRHAKEDSVNMGWRNAAFRGYADHMATEEFRAGLEELQKLARTKRTTIMCAEAVPWRCHRSLIGDALLARGVHVEDLLSATTSSEHELTPFAKVNGTLVTYPAQKESGIVEQQKLPLS